VLNPIERTSEVIFGLLMAMTFIGTLSIASEGRDGVRLLLIGALGCNVAWGLTDAVMYLIGAATEKRRCAIVLGRLRAAVDPATGRHLLADLLPQSLVASLGDDGLEELRRRLRGATAEHATVHLERSDYRRALGIFLLVVAATFPVALPFTLVHDTVLAVRLSQGIALAMLFLAGAALARYSGDRIWLRGTAMAGTGAALIVVIVALGG
jgi:hypothetical protein